MGKREKRFFQYCYFVAFVTGVCVIEFQPKLLKKKGSGYIMDDTKASNKEILLFSMSEEVGALARALKIFEVRLKKKKYINPISVFLLI